MSANTETPAKPEAPAPRSLFAKTTAAVHAAPPPATAGADATGPAAPQGRLTYFGQRPVKKTLRLDEIRMDADTQSRVAINEAKVVEYQQRYADGLDFDEDPVVFYDGSYWPGDGRHRLTAAGRAGRTDLVFNVFAGTRVDACIYSAGANVKHGLNPTVEDRRRASRMLLLALHAQGKLLARDERGRPVWSNRAIGRYTGFDHKSVIKLRHQLIQSGEIEPDEETLQEAVSQEERPAPVQPVLPGSRVTPEPEETPPAPVPPATPGDKRAKLLIDVLDMSRVKFTTRIRRGMSDDELLGALREHVRYANPERLSIGLHSPEAGYLGCKLGRKPKQEPFVIYQAKGASKQELQELRGPELAVELRRVFLQEEASLASRSPTSPPETPPRPLRIKYEIGSPVLVKEGGKERPGILARQSATGAWQVWMGGKTVKYIHVAHFRPDPSRDRRAGLEALSKAQALYSTWRKDAARLLRQLDKEAEGRRQVEKDDPEEVRASAPPAASSPPATEMAKLNALRLSLQAWRRDSGLSMRQQTDLLLDELVIQSDLDRRNRQVVQYLRRRDELMMHPIEESALWYALHGKEADWTLLQDQGGDDGDVLRQLMKALGSHGAHEGRFLRIEWRGGKSPEIRLQRLESNDPPWVLSGWELLALVRLVLKIPSAKERGR